MVSRHCWFHVLVKREIDVVVQRHSLVQVKRKIRTTIIAVSIFAGPSQRTPTNHNLR